MDKIYSTILESKRLNQKLLAILIDPDKIELHDVVFISTKINDSPATHIFIGGSNVKTNILDKLIELLKENCKLPIVLFPGNPSQISHLADGILFLSLISGRNPDFLIGHQVTAAPILKESNLEIIPSAYILIERGKKTAVEMVSQTNGLSENKKDLILHTAQAGEMMGQKLIYLEAGSGADKPISSEIIELISKNCSIPIIVGGGIRTIPSIDNAFKAGANLVVIGTAFENDYNFFDNYFIPNQS